MCKIEVAANKLGHIPFKGDYHHLHIIFTDEGGKQWGLRGGPSAGGSPFSELSGGSSRAGSQGSSGSGSNSATSSDGEGGGPFGKIVTKVAEYDEEFIDFPAEGETLPKSTISEGPATCAKFAELKEQMRLIDESKIRYSPLGPNSNTTVFAALRNVGLAPKVPEGIWAPGANDDLNVVQQCLVR